jgi:transcriptional regulator with XRE-family HTH domain
MSKNTNGKEKLNKANTLVNKYLCNFIEIKFLRSYRDQNDVEISQNKYADLCGLSSSTLSKLKSSKGYDIPMTTIYNICRHEKYSLKNFFKEFEDKYGINIPD